MNWLRNNPVQAGVAAVLLFVLFCLFPFIGVAIAVIWLVVVAAILLALWLLYPHRKGW